MRKLLLATTALVPFGLAPAIANPLGGQVAAGGATIGGTGTAQVTINQSTQNAVINWKSFNIGAGESTQFVQPNASASVLNRVTGDPNASQINGMLTANGRVFVINPNGILIGRGAVINTGSFLASTHDITNENFMAGRYNFNIPGRPDASIVNLGTITASNSGFAALVAPGVRNSGTITANFGKIGLASANGFSLDFYGDRLIQLDVNDQIAGNVRDVATGETLRALVQNDGKLKANGGRVELTAVAARQVVDSVINTSGVIEAHSIGRHGGKIVLGAATGSSKPVGAPTQTVKVSGKLSVASKKSKGGKVQITGENIELADARIDASGATGGGTVLIGGGPQGAGDLAHATSVMTGTDVVINADATGLGNGGQVVLWSDGFTSANGFISARGGPLGGNGGSVETSGKSIDFAGIRVDTSAPMGRTGSWLIDPINDLTIDAPNASTISSNLATTDVLVFTDGSGNTSGQGTTAPGPGDIIVDANISWGSGNTLTLSAFHDVKINDGFTIANTGAGNLVLRADNTGNGSGTINFVQATSGSRVDWTGSTGTVSFYYNPSSYSTPTDFTPTTQGLPDRGVTVASSSQFIPYMLVNSFANLQAMVDPGGSPNFGNYALGRDIDGLGGSFNPLSFTFNGAFDGSGGLGVNNTISNFTISSSQNPLGIFGFIGSSGTVRNLDLANVTMTVTGPGPNFVGLLAGQNDGTIDNVNVLSGTINGGTFSGIGAGGLVGQNRGTITNSTAAVNVTLGDSVSLSSINMAGGLVGSNLGTISDSSASGTITVGQRGYAGGLAGQNGLDGIGGAPGSIDLSSATGAVTGSLGAGGLVGFNYSNGTITNSYAEGNVTGTGTVTPFGSCTFDCQQVNAGGLVGTNSGLINVAYATGNVDVSSGGHGGGLVGFNQGTITTSYASGAVTGAAGPADPGEIFNDATILGGFVGTNQGTIDTAYATGSVGAANVARLLAGGFVGDNSGSINTASATGNVTAGDFSQAGGFAAGNNVSDCVSCGSQGIGFDNSATITNALATGNVSVGNSSAAGGFVGIGSTITDSSSAGAVTGGANSILGGFAGIHSHEGTISQSSASGPVTGTGAQSWVGGFVGWNIGIIEDSTASGNVSGTSTSVIGGFAGTNFGLIDPSFAFGAVNGSGSGNVIGGFAGVNFGAIDRATASGPVTGGAANIIGGVVGANATYINFDPNTFPFSSFPTGTLTNSTGPAGMQAVGETNPSKLPAYPAIIDACDNQACELVRTGILSTFSSDLVPNSVLAPWYAANFQIRPDNSPLPILIALNTSSPGSGSGGAGPGGAASYANAKPGQAGFTPPPWPQRMTVDGQVPSGMPAFGENRFRDNQLVLRTSADSLSPELLALFRQLGIQVVSTQAMSTLGGILVQLSLPPGMTVRQALARLEAIRIVPQIAPEFVFQLAQSGGGKGDPAQYILNKFQLAKTHEIATGKGITIAVIDSEVDKRHTELQGAISEELDTLRVKEPPHHHGTAMAGAIVSRDRLMGVAPGARIIAVRAFGEAQHTAEGTTLSIVKGIEWAVSQGAKVINMSFAGPRDPMLERALKAAREKGVILVAAAGNAGSKSPPLYPGADPNVIAVTATDVRDRVFSGANQGPQLSVAAPGVEVLAPAPDENYQMSTGTSIATAHVSGVVALMLERNPKLTPNDVRRILEETATDLGPKGKDAQFGWGLVNPQKALEAVEKQYKSSDASGARR